MMKSPCNYISYLYLNGVIEVHMESVAWTVWEELLGIWGEDLAAVLQLDPEMNVKEGDQHDALPDGVVGRPVAGAVETEAHNEDSSVHAELGGDR